MKEIREKFNKEIKIIDKELEAYEKLVKVSDGLKEEEKEIEKERETIKDTESGFYKDLSEKLEEKHKEFIYADIDRRKKDEQINQLIEKAKSQIVTKIQTKKQYIDQNRNKNIEGFDIVVLKEEKAKLEKEIALNDIPKEEMVTKTETEIKEIRRAKEKYLINKKRLNEIGPIIELADVLEDKTPKDRFIELDNLEKDVQKNFSRQNIVKAKEKEEKELLEDMIKAREQRKQERYDETIQEAMEEEKIKQEEENIREAREKEERKKAQIKEKEEKELLEDMIKAREQREQERYDETIQEAMEEEKIKQEEEKRIEEENIREAREKEERKKAQIKEKIDNIEEQFKNDYKNYKNIHLAAGKEVGNLDYLTLPKTIKTIEINEKDGTIYFINNRGEEEKRTIGEAFEIKSAKFKRLDIYKKCKEIAGGPIRALMLQRKVNPEIVIALENNEYQLEKYIASIHNKEELPFELTHNLNGIGIIDKIKRNRFTNIERKLGATVIGKLFNKNEALKEAEEGTIADTNSTKGKTTLDEYRDVIDPKTQAETVKKILEEQEAQTAKDVQDIKDNEAEAETEKE